MSRAAGYDAEDAAATFLAQQGYEVIARNYTVRGAEIDIIARDGGVYAFVEVKFRRSFRYGMPREAVTVAKRRRICMAALRWLQENSLPDVPVRFDVVEQTPQGMTLLRAAFEYTP